MAELVFASAKQQTERLSPPFSEVEFIAGVDGRYPEEGIGHWKLDRRLLQAPSTEFVREFTRDTLDKLAPVKNLEALLDARVSYDSRPLSERIGYALELRALLGTEPFPAPEITKPIEIEYPPGSGRINKMDFYNIGRAALLEVAAVDAWLEYMVPDALSAVQAKLILGNSALSNIEKPLELITARWLKETGNAGRFDDPAYADKAMTFMLKNGFSEHDVARIKRVNEFNTGYEGILAGLCVTPDLKVILTGDLAQKLSNLANDCVHGTQSKRGEYPVDREDLVRPDQKMIMIAHRYLDGLFHTAPGVRTVGDQAAVVDGQVQIIKEIRLDQDRPDGVRVLGPYGALKDLISSDTADKVAMMIKSGSRAMSQPDLLEGISQDDPYEFLLVIARRHLEKSGVI